MAHASDPCVTITMPGVQVASGASTSAVTSIPTNTSGNIPTKIRVSATAAACIRLGSAGVVATANDTMIQPGDSQLLRVPVGITKFAVIQVSAAGLVQVSPTEDA